MKASHMMALAAIMMATLVTIDGKHGHRACIMFAHAMATIAITDGKKEGNACLDGGSNDVNPDGQACQNDGMQSHPESQTMEIVASMMALMAIMMAAVMTGIGITTPQ